MPIRIIRRDFAAFAGGVLVSPKATAQTDTLSDRKRLAWRKGSYEE
jgi:hypothetical protein